MKKQNHNGMAFCETAVTYMKSLLSRRDFAGAARYYEDNRGLTAESGGLDAGAFLHEAALAYASLTNYSAALKAARTAQALVSAEGDCLLLAEIFLTMGEILRNCGELTEAQKAFRDAESIFRRNDCPEGQSRALNHLAGTYFRQTDFRNALAVLVDAVDIARKLDDNRKLAFMMGNIGRLNFFLGNFAEAKKHLQINIDLSTALADHIEVARALLSLGYVHLQQAEYSRAQELFDRTHPIIDSLNARREDVFRLIFCGELSYRTGRFDESRRLLEKALADAEAMSSGNVLAGQAMRHLAELYVRQGNFRLAEKFAARALVILQNAGDKLEVGALHKINAQIAAHQGKSDRARTLFMRALDILDEAGVRWEKTEALLAAGSSRAFGDRERMTYLFRAEEFYTRHHISAKQEEVSRMIAELGSFGPANTPVRGDSGAAGPNDYLTDCPMIKKIKSQLPMLAHTDLPVLITGETGVGKDHLARYFHSLVRPAGPYVAINCASVPENLLESELFGYRRGAFTGADGNKMGLFVAANGGILLLDEIGDMPLSLQAKLLGVLERRKVMPLGGTSEIDIDVILVAATNRHLEEMVELGTFRRDLYYRLSGITVDLPPLRERKEDIPLLVEHFMAQRRLLKRGQKLPADLMRRFIEYPWPGNVRELSNKVKRLEVMLQLAAEGDLVEIARSIFEAEQPDQKSGSLFERLEQFERQLITEALLATGGNKSEAARILGVHEATVRMKLKRYGIALAADSEHAA
jgi:two-component system, NtrC family, response regulator